MWLQTRAEQADGTTTKTVEEKTDSFASWQQATSCSLAGVSMKRLSKLYLLIRGGWVSLFLGGGGQGFCPCAAAVGALRSTAARHNCTCTFDLNSELCSMPARRPPTRPCSVRAV